MSLPEVVHSTLDDEPVAARVTLGGEDELLVTPTRTLIYRAEGLLSDESVEEFPHDAERVEVSNGRRKSKVTLDYGLDGERTFALPTKRLDEALHPVLAGVLNAANITDPGETVKQTFQFSELTVIVTSARLVKHIGPVVWDEEYEEFHYDGVTSLAFEEGDVATSVVVAIDGRQERFKAPNEQARAVRTALSDAVCAYHDVTSLEELEMEVPDDSEEQSERDNVSFGDGPDPLSATPGELAEEPSSSTRDNGSGSFEFDDADTPTATARADEGKSATVAATAVDDSSVDTADIAAEVRALQEVIEEQNERLKRQEDLVNRLIDELRQGR